MLYVWCDVIVQVMDRDAKLMRQDGPTVFTQARHNVNIDQIAQHILTAFKQQTAPVTS